MNALEFTVEGTPIAKGRPKFARTGGFVRAYTPKKTHDYEALVRSSFTDAHKHVKPQSGVVALTVRAYFPIPKSRPKRWREYAAALEMTPHVTRPDADNVLKALTDALNEVAWKDDSQVADVMVTKRYSSRPRLEVRIDYDGEGI